jgi:hypothetical protein
MSELDFLEGLLSGGASAALAAGILWWAFRRRPTGPGLPGEDPAGAAPPPSPPTPGPIPLDRPGRSTAVGAGPSRAEAPSTLPPGTPSEAIRLSSRIVLHLGALPPTPTGGTFPRARSQGGMVDALGVSQGPLANVLRRLVAGGVLFESREHVTGGRRRVKVYVLTSVGEAIARDLRHPRVGYPPGTRGGEPVAPPT